MLKKAPHTLLRWAFFGGAIYFALISIAHMFGWKVPIFFIYYNLPSFAYQDKLIALLAFGWAMFLYSGYKSTKANELVAAKYIIISLYGAIVGLIIINSSTNFNALVRFAEDLPSILRISHFWIETIILFFYPLALTGLYYLARKNKLQQPAEKKIDKVEKDPSKPDYSEEQRMYARRWR